MSEPTPSIKQTMDQFKPWFDYAGCILGVTAWFVAIGSVAVQAYRAKLDWADPNFWFATIATIPAIGFGVFLIATLYRINARVGRIVFEWCGETGWKPAIVGRLFVFWHLIGMISFITALAAHFAWVALGLYDTAR